jgi:hypothetical protein
MLSKLGIKPKDVVEAECPDFRIHIPAQGIVGVEVVRIFHPQTPGQPPMRERESLRVRVKDAAQEAYESLYKPPVHVLLYFNDSMRISKSQVEPMGQAVAKLVADNLPDVDRHVDLENDGHELYPVEIGHITIYRDKDSQGALWSVSEGAWLPELSADVVRVEIAKKEAKLNKYDNSVTEHWLLLVQEGSHLSSHFKQGDYLSDQYETRFARVLVLDQFRGSVQELSVRQTRDPA